jgi:hypothetical protein
VGVGRGKVVGNPKRSSEDGQRVQVCVCGNVCAHGVDKCVGGC